MNAIELAVPDELDIQEIPLVDEDIFDAMEHIPGYLDISSEDFRALYHLAHHHAVDRLAGSLRAEHVARQGFIPLTPDLPLDHAARRIVESGFKGLPVVDDESQVIGMLTETDFLQRLGASSFLELMLRLIDDSCEFTHRCHDTLVVTVMAAPAVTVAADADFRTIMDAFHRHPGRSMPVVDGDGKLLGLLLRDDVLATLHRNARS